MVNYKTNNPIFVTGVKRSGSTIIANVIRTCGVFIGNTNGMLENSGISKLVDDFYLDNSWDKRGQFPIPDPSEILIPTYWKEQIESELTTQGCQEDKPWMYKDARLAQIWPIWNYAYPNAKWIIVRRRTGDVIESCDKTAFMDAYKNKDVQRLVNASTEREGWLWWIHQQEQMFRDMIESGVNCKVVWPERILDGDFSQIYEALDWLGLKWNPKIIEVLNEALIKK